MIRVYVEDWTPPVWAVDTGPGTAQRRFEVVITETVGVFKYDLTADNKENPKAWVECPDEAILKIVNSTAILR